MSKDLQKILHEFAENFAQYHEDEDENYWWGHDTNLGTQEAAFKKAEKEINEFKRKNAQGQPTRRSKRGLGMPTQKKKAIAKAIFGNDEPLWWRGSTAEYELLEKIVNVKGYKS